MSYAVVRTDNLSGIIDGSKLVSVEFYNGSAKASIENGCIVKLDSYLADRDVWKVVAPSANDTVEGGHKLALIATPEVVRDKKYNALDSFVNEAGDICRAYILEHGDIYSVTAEAFSTSNAPVLTGTAKNKVVLEAAVKPKAVSDLGSGESALSQFAEVIGSDTENGYAFYTIRVN